MLYPDFHELVALKNINLHLAQPAYRASQSLVLGGQHSPFRGQGLEFDSVRKYVPGDDIRNIDWRVTARTGSPHLKIFREERERHVLLCVDMNSYMRFGTRQTFKSIQAARIASLLGWQGLASQDRISACLFGDVVNGIEYFAPKRTRQSFSRILKKLAEPSNEQHETSLAAVLQHLLPVAHTGSLIYLISDFMELGQTLLDDVSRLVKRCEVIFISVNDPADQVICPVGALGFCGKDKEKIMVDTDSLAGRQSYEEQWNENRKKLYAIGMKQKIPLIELTTESDVRRDLAYGLKKLVRSRK